MNNKFGVNQDIAQAMNRTLLLELLRKEHECSRAKLANLSGLRKATVTNIVNDFINWGLVEETRILTGKKGRRSIGITLNTHRYLVASIRLARKYFVVGLLDLNGNICVQQKTDTHDIQNPQIILKKIVDSLKNIIAEEKRQVLAVGIAIPGPFHIQKGSIELMTEAGNWKGINLYQVFTQAFELPVFMEHDAKAGAVAQLWNIQRNNTYPKMLAYVSVGQGVGAGMISNGQLLKGAIGMVGEIGHTTIDMQGPQCECGNKGCIEKYCSSISFLRNIEKQSAKYQSLRLADMKKLFEQNEPIIVREYENVAQKLAIGLINLIYSFNPDIIFIGDEMTKIAPERFLAVIKQEIKKRLLPDIYADLKIEISDLTKDEIFLGAAVIAIKEIFRSPLTYIPLQEK